ncbi:Hypothetical Protein FCC1311_101072 [Hondaea fermentalgiana]|uniref:Uncharacterized protein n=1 Tax=Hondaea fermentalgiana TaxID=2315210 RepID=A0A2R5H0P4_9STRA|nr:Hypothetical Protein FCC1311_101072 [Hondaea fermentalgiana]|eukprot:GBG33884.1 Hypothetical Protein FCC1311_101072 [Hondaea fermentalgiana]
MTAEPMETAKTAPKKPETKAVGEMPVDKTPRKQELREAKQQGRHEVRLGAACVAAAVGLWRAHSLGKARLGDTVKGERFLFYCFNVFEAAVNASGAFFLLAAPSYSAQLLCPTSKDQAALEHPATRFCLRLFGATEALVASVFAFGLKPDNAKTLLRSVLGADLLRLGLLLSYLADKPTNIIGPAVITHMLTMISVILAKLLYLF